MALQYFDKQLVIGYIMDAWQKHLNTTEDPANRKWFSNGPKNNGGLYGKLVDELSSDLVYRGTEKMVTQDEGEAYTSEVDNRDGRSPYVIEKPHYTYTTSKSISHTESDAIKATASVAIKGAAWKATFGIEYTKEMEEKKENTVTQTLEFEKEIPMKVPAGKVYRLVVVHNREAATIPYEAIIRIKGTSSACFKKAVKGQSIHTASAGELCEWISQNNSAGEDSKNFCKDPKNPEEGIVILHGKITADQYHNFKTVIYDVTKSYQGNGKALAQVVEEKTLG